MFIDIAVISGFAYSIIGNILNYIKNRENVENEVKEMDGEKQMLVINSLYNSIGLLSSEEREKNELILMRNKSVNTFFTEKASYDDLIYKIRYANNMSDLDKIYQKYDIIPNLFPISFPLKIHTRFIDEPVYHNYKYFDLKKSHVVNKILLDRRLPLTFMILGCSSAALTVSYLNYSSDKKWGYPLRYPILHPKRYANYTKDIKSSIIKWLK
jgi:hypothetical protein